jgi:hypothetical protein
VIETEALKQEMEKVGDVSEGPLEALSNHEVAGFIEPAGVL